MINNLSQYNTISFILRRIQTVNISSFELFTDKLDLWSIIKICAFLVLKTLLFIKRPLPSKIDLYPQ